MVYIPKPIQIYKKKQPEPETNYVLDYNDPLGINSAVDLIFNEAALNKHYATPGDIPGQVDLADVQQRVAAALDLTYRNTIRPIKEQGAAGFVSAGLNSLQNFGETVDLLANPVKGFLWDTENRTFDKPMEDRTRDFMRGLGTTEEGRYNYDYNIKTGAGGVVDFAANMAAEVVSDPFNWVSLGAWGASKVIAGGIATAAKPLIKEGVIEGAEAVGKAVAKDAAPDIAEAMAKEASEKVLASETKDVIADALAKSLRSANFKKTGDVGAAVADAFRIAQLPMQDEYVRATARTIQESLTKKLTTAVGEDVSLQVLKAVQKISKVNDLAQSGLTKAVGINTMFGPVVYALQKPGGALLARVMNKARKALDAVRAMDGTIPLNRVDEAVKAYSEATGYAAHLNDIPADIDAAIKQTEFYLADQHDFENMHKIINKHKGSLTSLQSALDQHILAKTEGAFGFESYTEYAQEFAQTHPDYQWYADELAAMRDTLHVYQTQGLQAKLGGESENAALLRTLSDSFNSGDKQMERLVESGALHKSSTGIPLAARSLEDLKAYQLQVSKAKSAFMIAKDSNLNQMFFDVLQDKGVVKELRNILTNTEDKYLYKNLIERLEVTAQAFFSMRQLLYRINNDDQLKPLMPRIYDILQTHSRKDLANLLASRDNSIENIIRDVDKQQLMKSQQDLFNLEKVLTIEQDKAFAEFIQPYAKSGELYSHDAMYDALKTYFLLTKDGPLSSYAHLLNNPQINAVVLDLETMALKSYGGQILQVGYVMNGKPYSIRIRAPKGVYPTEEVLYKLTNKRNRPEAKAVFDRLFTDESLPTESEALSNLMAMLQEAEKVTGKRTMLIGHNMETFDYQYLKQRMGMVVMDKSYRNFISNVARIDTLDLMYQLKGIPRMSLLQRSRLRSALSIYFTQRLNGAQQYATVQQKFINEVDRDFLYTLNQAKKTAAKTGRGVEVLQSLDTQLQGVYKALGDVRKINAELSKSSVYWDHKEQVLLDSGLNPIPMGDALHVMQLIGDTSAGSYSAGLKGTYDSLEFKRFFKVSEGSALNPVTLEKAEQVLYKLNGIIQSVKQVEKLNPHAQAMDSLYITLHNLLAQNSFEYKYMQVPPVGLADKYAALKLLYQAALDNTTKLNKVDLFNQTVSTWAQGRSPELIQYLTDVHKLSDYGAWVNEYTDDTLARFFEANETELLRKQVASDPLTVDIIKESPTATALRELGSMHTEEGIDSALIQAEISVLKPMLGNRENYVSYLDSLVTWDSAKGRLDYSKLEDFKNATIDYSDCKALAGLHALSKLTPDYLEKHMWENSMGVITFKIPDQASDFIKLHTQDYINHFLERTSEYAKADIHMYFDEERRRLWLGLGNSSERNALRLETEKAARALLPKDYKGPVYSELFVSQAPVGMEPYASQFAKGFQIVEDMEQLLNNLVHNTAAGSLGDTMDLRNMTLIYEAMPPVFKEKVTPLQELIDAKRFATLRFNHTNLGAIASRKELEPFVSRNIWKNYVEAVQVVAHRIDAKLKNKYMFFDPIKQLNGEAFGALSDQEVLEIFKAAPSYKAAALVDISDKTLAKKFVSAEDGIIMQDYPMNTLEQVRIARAANAIVMTPQAYLEAWRNINDLHVTPWAIKFMNKYIVGPTKVGYLTSIGWPFRNTLDSTVKNLVLAGNLEDSPAMMKHIWHTAKDVFVVNDIVKLMINHPENTFKQPSMRIADLVFAENPDLKISREVFQLYYDAMQQGATAGMAKAESDEIAAQFNKRADKTLVDKFMDKAVYHNPYTNLIMDTNSLLEQIMRLSGYTWSLTHGDTVDEALHAVWKNHFDYTTKSVPMMYAEVVVPFLSFTATNLHFWLHAIEEHPWLATIYRDMATPAWNFDETSNKELNENMSLQYQVLAGNISLPDNLVLKLNPSIADAIQLITNPTAWLDKITPVVRLPAQYFYQMATAGESDIFTDPMKAIGQNLPMIGPFLQRYWNAENDWEDGSAWKGYARITDMAKVLPVISPSIFGGVQRNYYFGYAGSGMVYMTHSMDKFQAQLKNGAVEITAPGQTIGGVPSYLKRPRKVYQRKRYYKRYYPAKKPRKARKVYGKKIYSKKTWAKKSYVPTNYSYTVQTRILASMRRSQMRMPGSRRNITHVAPSLYRRIYSATGRDIFKTRMIPMTQAYLISRLRQDWAYFRR